MLHLLLDAHAPGTFLRHVVFRNLWGNHAHTTLHSPAFKSFPVLIFPPALERKLLHSTLQFALAAPAFDAGYLANYGREMLEDFSDDLKSVDVGDLLTKPSLPSQPATHPPIHPTTQPLSTRLLMLERPLHEHNRSFYRELPFVLVHPLCARRCSLRAIQFTLSRPFRARPLTLARPFRAGPGRWSPVDAFELLPRTCSAHAPAAACAPVLFRHCPFPPTAQTLLERG